MFIIFITCCTIILGTMDYMHILIYTVKGHEDDNQLTDSHIAKIQQIVPDSTILIRENPTPEELKQTEIIIAIAPVKQLAFDHLPKLKWIHMTSAGVDTLPPEIKNSDIIVTNSSGVHPIPISEHVFTYMLMFARGFNQTTRNQFEKNWDREVQVFELHGKTIGIVGLGRIGKKVAEIAKAFQMKVLATARHTNPEEHVDQMFSMGNLVELLQNADFVVNCLPGTEETRGLFTLDKFKQMKRSSYFISIGRGFSTVEKDLITALQQKIIAGAGLDVFETEPLPVDSPLWEMEQVILTPHTAGKTPFYMNRVIDIFCENLQSFLTNKPLPQEVDKTLGY